MLLNVSEAQVAICRQNPLQQSFNYENDEERQAKEKEILKPGKVRLTLTCRILDFDPVAAK